MSEELNKPSETPEVPASRQGSNADFPTLFASIGTLIDSSIESITGIINSVNSTTKQVAENITMTANSDTVQGMAKNIGSLSENVIQGVSATLNSEELKKTFNELGNLASTAIDSAGSVARSEEAQNLFNTISTGLNQLLQTIAGSIQSSADSMHHKKAVEIPFSHKTPGEPVGTNTEPEKQQFAEQQPLGQQKGPDPAIVNAQKTESAKNEAQKKVSGSKAHKTFEGGSSETKKQRKNQETDFSKKGVIPRQKKRNN